MNEEHQLKIISELIETEKFYLAQIEKLQTFFSKPILEKGLLPNHVHSSIFGQLSAIYQTNSILLEEVSKGNKYVGQAFLRFGPFLKVYSSYAKNFQKSIDILEEWESDNEAFRSFLRCTETRPEVQTKLISLLITPIQRIPRYRLLLEELLKCLEKSSSLYADIQGALKKVNEAAKHVDRSVDETQSVLRLLTLQKALKNQQPSIIAPGRKLIKEGVLNKVSRKGHGSQERLFFLFSDMMMYTKVPPVGHGQTSSRTKCDFKPNSLECCCVLPLRYCRVTTLFGSEEQGITFRLQCSDEDLLLYSACSSEGRDWINCIKEAAQEALKKRKTLRKKSSRRKAIRRPTLRKMMSSEDDSSPEDEKDKDIVDSPNFLSDILNKTESLKHHLRNAKECFTPPSKKRQQKTKCTDENGQKPKPSTPLPALNTHPNPTLQTYPDPDTLYYNTGRRSFRAEQRPKPLSPLATTSWKHSPSAVEASPTPFVYRSGVRGKDGSCVTPQLAFTPSNRRKKRPISEFLSPSWKKRKVTKKD